MIEMVDLFTETGEYVGITQDRNDPIPKGTYMKVVQVWIKQSDGRFLIQQRNKKSDAVLNLYATHAGAVLSGEDPRETALREIYEEIGIHLDPSKLKECKIYASEFMKRAYLSHVYVIHQDIDINECTLDMTEVKSVRYVTIDELRALVHEKKFFGYEIVHDINYYKILESC
jgi:8-oxo-dGTP pyrophosphatase MutT (NUDIX family)